MKKQTKLYESTLVELQRLLDVDDPNDLPDAVRELQKQAKFGAEVRSILNELLNKLVEEVKRGG